eukprot:GHVQ01019201.1.p1 GENE.GHVQ01019201.1~~GHVQ01019201.1.p1  ORF type:complete len:713 (+),score=200.34 GHVQ01019201.1:83-2140(+)
MPPPPALPIKKSSYGSQTPHTTPPSDSHTDTPDHTSILSVPTDSDPALTTSPHSLLLSTSQQNNLSDRLSSRKTTNQQQQQHVDVIDDFSLFLNEIDLLEKQQQCEDNSINSENTSLLPPDPLDSATCIDTLSSASPPRLTSSTLPSRHDLSPASLSYNDSSAAKLLSDVSDIAVSSLTSLSVASTASSSPVSTTAAVPATTGAASRYTVSGTVATYVQTPSSPPLDGSCHKSDLVSVDIWTNSTTSCSSSTTSNSTINNSTSSSSSSIQTSSSRTSSGSLFFSLSAESVPSDFCPLSSLSAKEEKFSCITSHGDTTGGLPVSTTLTTTTPLAAATDTNFGSSSINILSGTSVIGSGSEMGNVIATVACTVSSSVGGEGDGITKTLPSLPSEGEEASSNLKSLGGAAATFTRAAAAPTHTTLLEGYSLEEDDEGEEGLVITESHPPTISSADSVSRGVDYKRTDDHATSNTEPSTSVTQSSDTSSVKTCSNKTRVCSINDWIAVVDPTGNSTYYWNIVTNDTSWVLPDHQKDEGEGKVLVKDNGITAARSKEPGEDNSDTVRRIGGKRKEQLGGEEEAGGGVKRQKMGGEGEETGVDTGETEVEEGEVSEKKSVLSFATEIQQLLVNVWDVMKQLPVPPDELWKAKLEAQLQTRTTDWIAGELRPEYFYCKLREVAAYLQVRLQQ